MVNNESTNLYRLYFEMNDDGKGKGTMYEEEDINDIMFDPKGIEWSNDGVHCFPQSDVLFYVQNGYATATLMQCTGLRDKAGNLIFKDDVINIPYNGFGNKVVEMIDGKWNISDYKLSSCTIVGNIHQNFEYLDSKKKR